MSSLLQFNGKITRRGVHLEFYTARKEGYREVATEEFTCSICGHKHPIIHIAIRKPAGMFGCWVVFRYNGEEHVPDLSIPIAIDKLPYGARRCDVQESAKLWHN